VLQITGDLTLECRVKFESLPADGASCALISKYDTGANKRCFMLYVYNVGGTYYLRFRADTGTGDASNYVDITETLGGAPATDGTWYVYRASFDVSAGTGKLFIDGSDVSAAVNDQGGGAPYTINNEDAPFLVGAAMNSGTPGSFFDGVIDAVVVANTYTSTHSEPLNVTPGTDYLEDMKGLWNFNSSSYDDEIESSDLTAPNGATFVDGYPFQL
jgi:hypothetical protein